MQPVVILFLLLNFWAATAVAFPSNTRLGYSSCQSCHLSPTGGGVLNQYGRMSAADFLSTWSYENEAEFAHGLIKDDMKAKKIFYVGGDLRQIRFRRGDYYRKIDMQQDLELALQLGKLTLVGSLGSYPHGQKHKAESRRNYLLYSHNENLSLRFGKYFLAYGIHHEDHTLNTRKGLQWEQGEETLNAELSWKNSYGEIFATANLGKSDHLLKAVDTKSPFGVEQGGGLRAAYYWGKNSQVGASYYLGKNNKVTLERQMFGPYAMLGLGKKSYALLEIDRLLVTGAKAQTLSYNLLGHEVYRGVHLQGFVEITDAQKDKGLKVQWFPRPHWELTSSYKFSKNADTASFLAHYYF